MQEGLTGCSGCFPEICYMYNVKQHFYVTKAAKIPENVAVEGLPSCQ